MCESGRRFWAIELEGRSVRFRYGFVGGKAQEKTRYLDSTRRAEREFGRRIRAKLALGYAEVDQPVPAPAGPAARNVEVERLLSSRTDADPAWAVYADWLHARGDPRGELANIQLLLTGAAPKPDRRRQLQRRVTELLDGQRRLLPEKLWKQLVGQRARRLPGKERRPGALAREYFATRVSVRWNAGFIRSLRIASGQNHPYSVEELAAETLSHESARFLRELTIGPGDHAFETYRNIPAIISRQPRPALRKLHLVDFPRDDADVSWIIIDDLNAIWRAAPNLEEIALHGGYLDLGDLDLPKARALTVWTSGLQADSLESLVAARWPHLEKLEILFGSRFKGAETEMSMLEPLLNDTPLPRLTHLGLLNSEFADEIAMSLPRAAIAAQIEHLDLSLSMLSDAGAHSLVRGRSHFPQLRSLDVSQSYLTASGISALEAAFSSLETLETANQRALRNEWSQPVVAIWER